MRSKYDKLFEDVFVNTPREEEEFIDKLLSIGKTQEWQEAVEGNEEQIAPLFGKAVLIQHNTTNKIKEALAVCRPIKTGTDFI